MTTGWFVDGALASDDRKQPPWRPSRRAFVLHRLAAVSQNQTFPALAGLASELQQELRGRWGDVALELAPAFR